MGLIDYFNGIIELKNCEI